MVPTRELAKTAVVLMLALLHACDYCPLPFGSIVALGVIQVSQLLASAAALVAAPPSKADKASCSDIGGNLGLHIFSKPSFVDALSACSAFRSFLWIILAVSSSRVLHMTGFAGHPLIVPLVACGFGAIARYATSKVAAQAAFRASTLSEPGFWPAVAVEESAVYDSPLVDLAAASHSTALLLQLPSLETEDGTAWQESLNLMPLEEHSSEVADDSEANLEKVEPMASPRKPVERSITCIVGMWIVSTVLCKQIVVASGLCDYPLFVLALACGVGAVCQCGTAAMTRNRAQQQPACAPDDPAFWPAVRAEVEDAEQVSPLFTLASKSHSLAMLLHLPAIELEAYSDDAAATHVTSEPAEFDLDY